MNKEFEQELFPATEEEDGSVSREQLFDTLEDYAVFRISLRDILNQAGVRSNPGWSDSDITAHLAGKLGVEDRYAQMSDTLSTRKKENPQK